MARILNQLLPGLVTPNDEQLLWRVQRQDDEAAFGELAQRWEQPIRRLCERMTATRTRPKTWRRRFSRALSRGGPSWD